MPRYIDADEFVKRVIQYPWQSTKTIGLALADTPTADVVEVKHGKWEKKWHSYFKQELPCCSVCGHFSAMRWKYCPECGADMRKEGGVDADS